MERIPGKTGPGAKVKVGAAGSGAAVANSGSSVYPRQEAAGGEEEWVVVRKQRRIEVRVSQEQIVSELHRIPAQPQIQGQIRKDAIIILEKSAIIQGAEIAHGVSRSRPETINLPLQEISEAVKIQRTANAEAIKAVQLVANSIAADSQRMPAQDHGPAIIKVKSIGK